MILSVPQLSVLFAVSDAGVGAAIPVNEICAHTGLSLDEVNSCLAILTSPAHPIIMGSPSEPTTGFNELDLVEFNAHFDPLQPTDEDDPFILSSLTSEAQIVAGEEYGILHSWRNQLVDSAIIRSLKSSSSKSMNAVPADELIASVKSNL